MSDYVREKVLRIPAAKQEEEEIWQQVLCYQMFGAIFERVFIPHYSAWLYCGCVPVTVGLMLIGGVL